MTVPISPHASPHPSPLGEAPIGHQPDGTRAPLRFGLHSGPQNCTFAELADLWRIADSSGFWWTSVWDHFYPAQVDPSGDCFEAVASHAALAARTRNLRCGCFVYAAAYRNPALLVKSLVTIDHISGGRAELGIGAGWHDVEFKAFGVPFLPPGQRLAQLEEAIQIIRGMWSGEPFTLEGQHFQVHEILNNPMMLQASPRLWMGALGDRNLALTGKYADGWNSAFVSPEAWGKRSEKVSAAAEKNGRDPNKILRSVNLGLAIAPDAKGAAARREALRQQFGPATDNIIGGMLVGTPSELIDRVGEYREAGADLVVVALRAPFDVEGFELFINEVMPAFPGSRIDG